MLWDGMCWILYQKLYKNKLFDKHISGIEFVFLVKLDVVVKGVQKFFISDQNRQDPLVRVLRLKWVSPEAMVLNFILLMSTFNVEVSACDPLSLVQYIFNMLIYTVSFTSQIDSFILSGLSYRKQNLSCGTTFSLSCPIYYLSTPLVGKRWPEGMFSSSNTAYSWTSNDFNDVAFVAG